MKSTILSLTLLSLITGSSLGFVIIPNKKSSKTSLQMGFFDLKPFRGSGSASENDLEEQWRLQQEKLAARRAHLDKEHLKAKYKGGEGKFEVHNVMPKEKSHMDDMYIEENVSHHQNKSKKVSFSFKFPWDK